LVALAQPDSILISRTFAEKYRLRDGDKLPLYTAQGRKEFVVRGIFRPVGVGEIFDGQIAVMDVFNAQYIFSRGRNIDRIDLMNEPEIDVDALAARIRARLPAGIEVTPPTARGQGIEKAVSAMRIGMLIRELHRPSWLESLSFLTPSRSPSISAGRRSVFFGRSGSSGETSRQCFWSRRW
jgi:ABC-type lipoprotein release transport system permease subunit